MKSRDGFVSNSSSSSFTCDVCRYTASGWDMCLSECDMTECCHGHTFCCDHKTEGEPSIAEQKEEVWGMEASWIEKYAPDRVKELVQKGDTPINEEVEEAFEVYNEEGDEGGDGYYECMTFYCPLCNMSDLSNEDLITYLLHERRGQGRKSVVAEVKEKYGTYDKFLEAMKV